MKPPETPTRSATYHIGSRSIVGVWDPQQETLVCLVDRDRLSFGRARISDVQVMDPWVSLMHCTLERGVDDVWILYDHSRNGTCVNEVPVTAPVPLTVGMHIQLGDHRFVTVGSDERLFIRARDPVSLLAHAAELYGSTRKAGAMVGKSHATVGRAYRARFPRRGRKPQ